MRPTTDELLRGLQASLLTYVLPEVQSEFARTEVMLAYALLGIAANEWDGAAQSLVDDNAAMRPLLDRAADAVDDSALASELRALAGERAASLRLSGLAEANRRLRDGLGRLGVALEGREEAPLRELRAGVIAHLLAEAEARNHHVLGPRADG
jgi:hypothetical protein